MATADERLPCSLLVLAHTFITSLPTGLLAFHSDHQGALWDRVPCGVFAAQGRLSTGVFLEVPEGLYCTSGYILFV